MNEEALDLLVSLIRCPSVTPEPAGGLDLLQEWLVALDFDVTRLTFDGDGSYPVENLFATRGTAGPHLLFAGHTDVVPPGDSAGWTYPPFAAKEADGRLYGRGAADMKSGIAAFVAAAADVIRTGEADRGRLSLAITNDEEADSINGTDKLMAWAAAQGHRFDFAIVGEPSSLARVGDRIKIGRRGSLNAGIVVTGVQGHVAYPDRAENPLPVLARIVTALSGRLDAGSAAFPPSNLEFTSIDVGNPVSNVIPAAARARLNVRYNDGWTPESLAAHLRDRLRELAGPAAELTVLGQPSRAFLSPGNGTIELLAETIQAETGGRPDFSTTGGTSDARFIAPYCPVVELGIVGPSMHQVDESIALADLHALTALYRRFIARFLAT
jgi:succinyl-diaminopimelate desuccinylase